MISPSTFVGFVFQFYNLIPSLTALENVQLVTEISRNPMTPDEALALVGLLGRQVLLVDPPVGMVMRVLVAGAVTECLRSSVVRIPQVRWHLADRARPGDVVMTLGAGDIAMIGAEVLDLLRAREGTGQIGRAHV